MQSYTTPAGIPLFYPPGEEAAAHLIAEACDRSLLLARDRWGLAPPADCRVYVATDWRAFLFLSAPRYWKPFLVLYYPLYAWRMAAMWPMAGGLTLAFGQRKAVAIKPPHMLETSDTTIGQQIYISNPNVNEKVQTITCHEMVHTCTQHLRLPAWLNEGLATLAMEHYLGRPVVRPDTLERAELFSGRPRLVMRPSGEKGRQPMLEIYIFGYWLTRYMEDTRPDLLKVLLTRHRRTAEMENMAAAAFGMSRQDFWKQIGGKIRLFYGEKISSRGKSAQ